MFTAALFTTAKIWNQPKCPSTDKWLKKMWYIFIGIVVYIHLNITQPLKSQHFAIYGNTDGHRGPYVSEISQTERDKYCMISLICGI